MGQHIMTCPGCGKPRDFMGETLADHCLYCGHSYKDEGPQLTVEQEASMRLAPYFQKVQASRGDTQ